MGVILGSGVVPIALCVTWSKANRMGCISGAVIGLVAGIAVWLGITSGLNGGIINVTVSHPRFVFMQDFSLRWDGFLLDKRRYDQG